MFILDCTLLNYHCIEQLFRLCTCTCLSVLLLTIVLIWENEWARIQLRFGSVQLHVLKLHKELHVWYNKQYKWSADSLWNCLLIYIDCLTLLLMPLFYLRRIINSHDVNTRLIIKTANSSKVVLVFDLLIRRIWTQTVKVRYWDK